MESTRRHTSVCEVMHTGNTNDVYRQINEIRNFYRMGGVICQTIADTVHGMEVTVAHLLLLADEYVIHYTTEYYAHQVRIVFPALCTAGLCACQDPYAIENRSNVFSAMYDTRQHIQNNNYLVQRLPSIANTNELYEKLHLLRIHFHWQQSTRNRHKKRM
jgi:hypothetical protein